MDIFSAAKKVQSDNWSLFMLKQVSFTFFLLIFGLVNSNVVIGSEFDKCVVCTKSLSLNDNIEQACTHHIFHQNCLDKWKETKLEESLFWNCPLCRQLPEVLNISDKNFDDEDVVNLAAEVRKSETIRELIMSTLADEISEASFYSLIAAISNNQKVIYWDISGNYISTKVERFIDELKILRPDLVVEYDFDPESSSEEYY